MLRIAAAATVAAAAFLASEDARADVLTVHDEKGMQVEIDTAALAGCLIVFDSAGAPFEICRMKRVELTPPASTRSRPGHSEDPAGEAAQVIYVKASE